MLKITTSILSHNVNFKYCISSNIISNSQPSQLIEFESPLFECLSCIIQHLQTRFAHLDSLSSHV